MTMAMMVAAVEMATVVALICVVMRALFNTKLHASTRSASHPPHPHRPCPQKSNVLLGLAAYSNAIRVAMRQRHGAIANYCMSLFLCFICSSICTIASAPLWPFPSSASLP